MHNRTHTTKRYLHNNGVMYNLLIALFFILFNSVNYAQENINWNKSAEAFALADTSGKPVMVFFHADWCKWCKEYETSVFTDNKTNTLLNSSFVNVKINPEKKNFRIAYNSTFYTSRQFADKFKVENLPVILFFNSKGKLLGQLNGFYNNTDFLKALKYILQNI